MASIQTVYVALFGRPADPAGLAFFNGVTSNGADLTAIGDLAATSEYQSRFAGKSNTQIVTDIYMSLFGHAPDAAGLAFFVDALNTGAQNINSIAINIADGALGTDKTLLEKKVAAADLFTAALDTPVEVGNYTGLAAAAQGAAYIAGVTAASPAPTAAAADAAVALLGTGTAPGVTGVNINLVTGAESVSPSAADPAFKSTAGDDKISGVALGAANIDASGGSDSLTLTGHNAAATLATITGTEKFYVAATAAANGLDFSKTTGEAEVWATKGAGGTHSNITKGTALGVDGAQTGLATFGFTPAEVAGAGDAATLNLKAATGAAGVDILGIETLTVANTGTSNIGAMTSGNAASTVMLTGSGSFTGIPVSTALTKFDASGFTGQTNVNLGGASAAGVTFTGAAGMDTVTLTAGTKDTVVYTKGNISTISTADSYTAFVTGTDKIDLKALGLTGGTGAITTFTPAPSPVAEGTSFGGNAVGQQTVAGAAIVYVDSNNDGVYNQATDLAFTTVGNATIAVGDVIFA
ncbi:MAG: DUF4214 domain-containing protein [Hoeflea sp.]|nr:DUF4214 domain-containing protein [Hoeflea sp.]